MAADNPATILTEAVEHLVEQLRRHEAEADAIRATLKQLRGKIAAAGKRAGPKARSGRRRKVADEAPKVDAQLQPVQ